jgi:hypothetical protein
MRLRNPIVCLVSIIIVSVCAWPLAADAQQSPSRRPMHTRPVEPVEKAPPIALLQEGKPDYLSGESSVSVRGNQDAIIRLGLAQNGVTMLEFPAADRFFALHPGNSDLVTVDDSPTKATDHFLILRAGSGFASPALVANAGKGPATSIIVQMQSGMVITFLIYPVNQIAQQAHRCVVSYDRDEVVSARRAAGLAVNLDRPDPERPRTVSLKVAPEAAAQAAAPVNATVTPTNLSSSRPRTLPPVLADIDTKRLRGRDKRDSGDAAEAAAKALGEAVKSPGSFKNWSRPEHGLSLSVSQVREVDEHTRVFVVAVRNSQSTALRLLPGAPELFIQTFDDKGKPLQVEQLRKLRVETTTMNGAIPAGATVYYAVVYETPILGVSQRLRVGLAQIDAADTPSTAELGSVK